MKLLPTAAKTNAKFIRLIRECTSCEIAVAWASAHFAAFDLLLEHREKIGRMVVGTHFYQTDPSFIKSFRSSRKVRFLMNTEGIFHPKVYFFEMPGGSWQAIIGSANFTRGGMGGNDEVAVLISSDDEGAEAAASALLAAIEGYWKKATSINAHQLEAYQKAWSRKKPLVKKLQGAFGDPLKDSAGDKGRRVHDIPILQMDWGDYFAKVRAEREFARIADRLSVIRAVRQVFAEHDHFSEIAESQRRQIAGLDDTTEVTFRLFGSMIGSGKFQRAINDNDENLSLALDVIPTVGPVSRDIYCEYVERYKRAFPEGRHGIATATRLLAMKRPDTFVCLDSRNTEGLCDAFEIRRKVSYESYWDSIIERIMEAEWWLSRPPQKKDERDVWEARAAFLDSLFYDGTGVK